MALLQKMNKKQIKRLMTGIDLIAIAFFVWIAYKFLNPLAEMLRALSKLITSIPIKEANPEYKLVLILVSGFFLLWFLNFCLTIISKVAENLKSVCERELKKNGK